MGLARGTSNNFGCFLSTRSLAPDREWIFACFLALCPCVLVPDARTAKRGRWVVGQSAKHVESPASVELRGTRATISCAYRRPGIGITRQRDRSGPKKPWQRPAASRPCCELGAFQDLIKGALACRFFISLLRRYAEIYCYVGPAPDSLRRKLPKRTSASRSLIPPAHAPRLARVWSVRFHCRRCWKLCSRDGFATPCFICRSTPGSRSDRVGTGAQHCAVLGPATPCN